MRIPKAPLVITILVLAVVVQTALLGRIRSWAPDLVVLTVVLFAMTRIRVELVLLIGFVAGLVVDLAGTSLTGLRAVVYTAVAYAAIRTTHYAEIGRIATGLWGGILTFMALALVVIIGTLFGQNLVGPDIGNRMIIVPLLNAILAALVAPSFSRLIDRDTGIFGYT